jgi:phosphodiesterase/alkaline phosphatase D-like protein
MKIAFTSCINFEVFPEQPEWKDMGKEEPDYLFLLGDQVYLDKGNVAVDLSTCDLETFKEIVTKKYSQQWNEQNFKALLQSVKTKGGLFGVWDDHDFLWNNAKGAELKSDLDQQKMVFSKEMFHRYFENCSTNLPELYYVLDTPYARIIFLDNRSYAQNPGAQKELLGEKQFQFLEEKLKHDLPYTLVCGGLTLSGGFVLGVSEENWLRYPQELQRFSELLSIAPKPLFLSGDVHNNHFIPPRKLKQGIKTPAQIISSGFQVLMAGIQHNWAMLHFDEQGVQVQFYKKKLSGKGTKEDAYKTNLCNNWLSKHAYFRKE